MAGVVLCDCAVAWLPAACARQVEPPSDSVLSTLGMEAAQFSRNDSVLAEYMLLHRQMGFHKPPVVRDWIAYLAQQHDSIDCAVRSMALHSILSGGFRREIYEELRDIIEKVTELWCWC